MTVIKEKTDNNIINANSIVKLIKNYEKNTVENFYHKSFIKQRPHEQTNQ